jgi:hypothetical protein
MQPREKCWLPYNKTLASHLKYKYIHTYIHTVTHTHMHARVQYIFYLLFLTSQDVIFFVLSSQSVYLTLNFIAHYSILTSLSKLNMYLLAASSHFTVSMNSIFCKFLFWFFSQQCLLWTLKVPIKYVFQYAHQLALKYLFYNLS